MKHKSPEEIERRQKKIIAKLQAEYDRLLKQNQAGEQVIAAANELNHIGQRMLQLLDEGKEDSPEYHQLEHRFQMLNNFQARQNLLFEGINL